MMKIANKLLIKRAIIVLLFSIFLTQESKATWCVAGNLSKGAITPAAGAVTTAGFNPSGKVPYWSFAATAGVTYYFSLCASANSEDGILNIYDATTPGGNLVAANDEGVCANKSSLTFIAPASITYYVAANLYPWFSFATTSNLALTYQTCGAPTGKTMPYSEDWTTSDVTTPCTGWVAHGAGGEGDWYINPSGGLPGFSGNQAGASGNEAVFIGNQANLYGTGITKTVTLTSPMINTTNVSVFSYSFKHSLGVTNSAASGTNTMIIKLQSSADLITWTDQYSQSVAVSASLTTPVWQTVTTSSTFNPASNTTWLRFTLVGIPYKVWGWFIDNGSTSDWFVLPVELENFSVKQLAKKNKLEWTTVSETNNSYFTVERSANGIEFTEIVNLKGAGNSNSSREYVAFDEDPLQGINYYRLKQTDLNGAYKYSKIISVNDALRDPAFSNLYPNPSSNTINFDLYSPSKTNAGLQVVDIAGRLVIDEKKEVLEGDQSVSMQIETLARGIYYLKISMDELGYNYTTKLIKN